MTVQLPMASVDRFEALLQALEGARARLGVASYGMSVTTLEEVFNCRDDASHQDLVASQRNEEERSHTVFP
jgi:hypothetical protein